ncbi:redox-regulated ATPase YchF, partial [Candidatus Saccharibacteria bacterium]|nr:redox-regulated ATPase YchF [Candidatus Saccharibacteria bacterium]
RLPRLEKETKADPKLKPLYDTLSKVKNLLEAGTPVHQAPGIEQEHIADLFLLTAKPVIYVFNLDDKSLQEGPLQKQVEELVRPANAIFVSAKLESELRGLDETDRVEFLESYGQKESGLVQLIHAAYDTLELQSFLTAGEKEVRAWTISRGTTAREAAGVIHTDFARGFIAAQVVDYYDLIEAGSLVAARSVGKVRTEGRDYIMQPDDVVEFRFNV